MTCSSRTFVETVKGCVSTRDMKQVQQPIIKDKEKPRRVEKRDEVPTTKPCTCGGF